jgi:hypothetical protein
LINNTWTIVSVLSSDVTGRVAVAYTPNIHYKFITLANGYTIKEFELNPIIFSSYNVWLDKNETTPSFTETPQINIYYDVEPFTNNQNSTITFNYLSPEGSFENYNLTIQFKNETYFFSDANAYGGVLNHTILIHNATTSDNVFITYGWKLSNSTTGTTKTLTYGINGLSSGVTSQFKEKYGLGIGDRVLIYLVIVLIMAFAGMVYGGVVGAGICAFLMMGYFAYVQFLPPWLIVPSMVIFGAILIFGGSKIGR